MAGAGIGNTTSPAIPPTVSTLAAVPTPVLRGLLSLVPRLAFVPRVLRTALPLGPLAQAMRYAFAVISSIVPGLPRPPPVPFAPAPAAGTFPAPVPTAVPLIVLLRVQHGAVLPRRPAVPAALLGVPLPGSMVRLPVVRAVSAKVRSPLRVPPVPHVVPVPTRALPCRPAVLPVPFRLAVHVPVLAVPLRSSLFLRPLLPRTQAVAVLIVMSAQSLRPSVPSLRPFPAVERPPTTRCLVTLLSQS